MNDEHMGALRTSEAIPSSSRVSLWSRYRWTRSECARSQRTRIHPETSGARDTAPVGSESIGAESFGAGSLGAKSFGAVFSFAPPLFRRVLFVVIGLILLTSIGCLHSPPLEVDPRVSYQGVQPESLLVRNVQKGYTEDGRLRARFEIHNVSSKSQLFHLVVFFQDERGNILNGDAEKQIHLLAPSGIEPVDDHWYGYDAKDFTIALSLARTD